MTLAGPHRESQQHSGLTRDAQPPPHLLATHVDEDVGPLVEGIDRAISSRLIFSVMAVPERRGPGRRPTGRPGDPLQPTTISKDFPATMVAAGLPRLRFHNLRHSTASFLLHMGIPPLEVARILGHSSVTTTLTIYAHAMIVVVAGQSPHCCGDLLTAQQQVRGALEDRHLPEHRAASSRRDRPDRRPTTALPGQLLQPRTAPSHSSR